ncbi:hypothetical protein [Rhodococcus sp. NPDC058639]|uniref:hypothetical protein n=1 Tax=Rhodococcus sp. NPDC058639 TaxID=3346570 RepID=UPI003657AF33
MAIFAVIVIGRDQGWDYNRWGNAGTWFAGIATAGSVLTAVWVAVQSRKAQIRLFRAQLESDVRQKQREAVLTLWFELKERFSDIQEYRKRWEEWVDAEAEANGKIGCDDEDSYESARVESRNALLNWFSDIEPVLESMRLALIPAILVIRDSRVREKVSLLRSDYFDLRSWNSNAEMMYPHIPDLANLKKIEDEINTHSRELYAAADTYLGHEDLIDGLIK